MLACKGIFTMSQKHEVRRGTRVVIFAGKITRNHERFFSRCTVNCVSSWSEAKKTENREKNIFTMSQKHEVRRGTRVVIFAGKITRNHERFFSRCTVNCVSSWSEAKKPRKGSLLVIVFMTRRLLLCQIGNRR